MPKTSALAPPAAKVTTPAAASAAPVSGPGRTLYATTILLSAFLLFLIQPILAKVILPWFGGVASVWTVAILFFQGVLLLGYTYSYLSVKYLPPAGQALVHMVLLAGSLAMLPVSPWRVWQAGSKGDPAMQILLVLLLSAGLPYFLLSTTGPLVQSWFARSQKVAFPYRLFALSNFGSLAALLAYPFVVEPYSTTRQQLGVWSLAYGAFVVLGCAAAVCFWRFRGSETESAAATGKASAAPTWREYAFWTGLAGCGSALLVTITNHICQNVAPMPLLWILPLAAYLLTFVLCFDRSGWYRPNLFRWGLPVVLLMMLVRALDSEQMTEPLTEVTLFLAGLFVCCLFCHGELAARKPHARYLTSFYLMVALGGALGSTAVGLIAPHASTWQIEFPEVLVVCGLLAFTAMTSKGRFQQIGQGALGLTLVLLMVGVIQPDRTGVVALDRSFYGALMVRDEKSIDRMMYHGRTRHGMQIELAQYKNFPTTYYGPLSGVGMPLRIRTAPWRVGVVGLGAGTLAAYGRRGDSFRFYEIDPLVAKMAQQEFSFLSGSRAKVDVAIGDGRLLLNREAPSQFDFLAVDAFSGDSIPTHLLTKEAFALYFKVLKPEGVLAVHISNKFLDLTPVLASVSAELKRPALFVRGKWNATLGADESNWVLMSANSDELQRLTEGKGTFLGAAPAGFRTWTDDYSNLLKLVR